MKQVVLTCEGCGSRWTFRVDENLQIGELKLKTCKNCSKAKRKKVFKTMEKRGFRKEIRVEGLKEPVLVEVKSYKCKKY